VKKFSIAIITNANVTATQVNASPARKSTWFLAFAVAPKISLTVLYHHILVDKFARKY
jgi:hypothetical protein